MIVSGTFILVIFLGIFFLVFRVSDEVPQFIDGTEPDASQSLEAYLAEKERASAYEALREHLDQKRNEPGIVAVFCRDCRHRWEGDRIEFRGDVDIEVTDGRLLPFIYTAALSGSSVDGWKVESVQLEPKGLPVPPPTL